MGKADEIRLLYNLLKDEITHFEIIDINAGIDEIIKQESIIMNEETMMLMKPDTKQRLNQIISDYNSVFVKVNEASGIDAKFLLTQLKCFSIEDILILIKGSERMMDAYEKETIGSVLLIKEWYKIEERNEFRCYGINNELKGISQRYINSYMKYSNDEIDKISECITTFFNSKIKEKILSIKSELYNNETMMLVIDLVYLPKKNKVKIIDLELIHYEDDIQQDKLKLYASIEELKEIKDKVDFRFITSEDDSRIPNYEPNSNQFPLELYETDIHTLINQLDIK